MGPLHSLSPFHPGSLGTLCGKVGLWAPLCFSSVSLVCSRRGCEKKGLPGGGHSPGDGNRFLPGQRGVTKLWHGAGCVLQTGIMCEAEKGSRVLWASFQPTGLPDLARPSFTPAGASPPLWLLCDCFHRGAVLFFLDGKLQSRFSICTQPMSLPPAG